MVAMATGIRRWTSGAGEDDRSVLERIDPLFLSTCLPFEAVVRNTAFLIARFKMGFMERSQQLLSHGFHKTNELLYNISFECGHTV